MRVFTEALRVFIEKKMGQAHFATHTDASYVYKTLDGSIDYTKVMSYPLATHEAYQKDPYTVLSTVGLKC